MHTSLLAGTDTTTPRSITPRSLPLLRAISLMLWKVSFPPAPLWFRLKKHWLKIVGSNLFHHSISLRQAWRETLACDLQTVPRVFAAPGTSGLASVSPCWQRVRCVHATVGKAPTAWSFSSAATVEKAWPADQRGASVTTVSAGLQPGTYTPVRDVDTDRNRTTCSHNTRHTHKHTRLTKQTGHKHWQTLFSLWYTRDADTHTQAPNTKHVLSCQSCRRSARKDEAWFMENWYAQRDASLQYGPIHSPQQQMRSGQFKKGLISV